MQVVRNAGDVVATFTPAEADALANELLWAKLGGCPVLEALWEGLDSAELPESLDVATEIQARMRHHAGCIMPGNRWETLEPAGRPGVLVVSAECPGCGAQVTGLELAIRAEEVSG